MGDGEAWTRVAQSNGRCRLRHQAAKRATRTGVILDVLPFLLEFYSQTVLRAVSSSRGSDALVESRWAYHRIRRSVFSSAPSGSTPVSRNRQSAIKSFLATPTIPIFRMRLLPDVKQPSLSNTLADQYIGLEEMGDGIWNILYYRALLGRIDERTRRITGVEV